MRVDIENMLRQIGATASKKYGYQYMLSEFTKHLKQLRDRTLAGDMTVLDEFFKLYVFDDGKDYEDGRRTVETSTTPKCTCPGIASDFPFDPNCKAHRAPETSETGEKL